MKKLLAFTLCLATGLAFGSEGQRAFWVGSSKDPKGFEEVLTKTGVLKDGQVFFAQAALALCRTSLEVEKQLQNGVTCDQFVVEFVKPFYQKFPSPEGKILAAVPYGDFIQMAASGEIAVSHRFVKPSKADQAVAQVSTVPVAIQATPVAQPAQTAAVPAASAPTPTPTAAPAAAPAVDQVVIKRLAERFDQRLHKQQTAQEAAEKRRVAEAKEFAAKIRELEGQLQDAPDQAAINALKGEIAATKIANSQAEEERKRALSQAVGEAKAARDEVTQSFFYKHGDWVWAGIATLILLVIVSFAYIYRQGSLLRKEIKPIKESVHKAVEQAVNAQQTAQKAKDGADNVGKQLEALAEHIPVLTLDGLPYYKGGREEVDRACAALAEGEVHQVLVNDNGLWAKVKVRKSNDKYHILDGIVNQQATRAVRSPALIIASASREKRLVFEGVSPVATVPSATATV